MTAEASGNSGDTAATLTGTLAAGELRPGDLLAGRFRIESLLGIGGMGVVYRARDLSLDIEVALKLLRPDLARRPEAFANFRQELLLARQVSSPHVVRIHDIAEHEGRWFISMDLIGGESLERRLDHCGRLPLEQALAIVRGLLEGLAAAHQRGVVHRDLKPANVLLEGDHAYITDFGVARVLGATGMTHTGMIVGTPEYLSPEQARGTTIDARSDLYAVGLILFEMLAGELPFSGGTPAEAVMQRILRPPPSLARVRPDLPGWLHAFAERLLKVNPAHRFASARDALKALDARRVPRPPLDRRVLLLAVLGVVALGAAARWAWRVPAPATAIAAAPAVAATPRIGVLPFDAADGDEELAALARAYEEQLRGWLRGDASVASIPRRRVLDARARIAPELHGEALARLLPEVAGAANATRLARGSLRRDASGLVLELAWVGPARTPRAAPLRIEGRDAAALHAAWAGMAGQWLAAAGLQAGPMPPLAATQVAAYGRALARLDEGDAKAAAAELAPLAEALPPSALVATALLDAQERALEDLPAANTRAAALRTFGDDASPAARELVARALVDEGDDARARAALVRARRDFPADPRLLVLQAQALADGGDGAGAIALLARYAGDDDQDARVWFLLGRYSIQQGQAQRAVDDYLVRALVLNTRARDAAAEAETRNALGIGYERLGQLDASIEQYTRAATMRERLGDTTGLARTLRNLAIVQAERGDREAAERTLDRVKGLLEGAGDRASLADLANDRGVIAEERGDFAAALAAYREALTLRQQLDQPDQVAESLNNVGFASFRLGRFDDALVYWQQAQATYRRVDDRNGLLRIEQSIGLLDLARGRFGGARERLQATLREAEDRQLSEEASVAHVDLAEVALVEGRAADAARHAAQARRIAAGRSDQRTEAEANLLAARVAHWIGDADGIDAALAAIPFERLNGDQRAMYLLAEARRAQARGDAGTATAKLAEAQAAAEAAHSGRLVLGIRLHQARFALDAGEMARARRLLAELRRDPAPLGDVPTRLEWLELEMRAAFAAGDRAGTIARYREALPLIRAGGRWADAAIVHALAARAFAPGSADATAAEAAAAAARAQALDDAPVEARERLAATIDARIHAASGVADGR